MHEANLRIIGRLKRYLTLASVNKSFLKRFSFSDRDFTRTRKLPFEKIVLFITKLSKKSLSIELDDFFEEIGSCVGCSVSAFSQQRTKLKPDFFSCWNSLLQRSFYLYYGNAVKRWKGYRLIAGDGSAVSLVNTPILNKYFGGQSNQFREFVQAKTFYHYDVLNELIVLAEIKPYRCGEMNMAFKAVREVHRDMIMIYDRNFCNYKMVALHLWQEQERKFVIRAKETQNIIKTFIQSGKPSSIVDMLPTPSAIIGLKKSGFNITKNTSLRVRLVRVELPNSVEVLITNLWEQDGHSTEEFKDLYFMRWRVETSIWIQKNILQMESFSGLTVCSVLQGFHATIMIFNLHSILMKEAQQTVEITQRQRKYPIKINRNKSMGKLKTNLIPIFIHQDPKSIVKKLHDLFIRHVLPVRKGRSFNRIRKNVQSKSRYKTFSNFKSAY